MVEEEGHFESSRRSEASLSKSPTYSPTSPAHSAELSLPESTAESRFDKLQALTDTLQVHKEKSAPADGLLSALKSKKPMFKKMSASSAPVDRERYRDRNRERFAVGPVRRARDHIHAMSAEVTDMESENAPIQQPRVAAPLVADSSFQSQELNMSEEPRKHVGFNISSDSAADNLPLRQRFDSTGESSPLTQPLDSAASVQVDVTQQNGRTAFFDIEEQQEIQKDKKKRSSNRGSLRQQDVPETHGSRSVPLRDTVPSANSSIFGNIPPSLPDAPQSQAAVICFNKGATRHSRQSPSPAGVSRSPAHASLSLINVTHQSEGFGFGAVPPPALPSSAGFGAGQQTAPSGSSFSAFGGPPPGAPVSAGFGAASASGPSFSAGFGGELFGGPLTSDDHASNSAGFRAPPPPPPPGQSLGGPPPPPQVPSFSAGFGAAVPPPPTGLSFGAPPQPPPGLSFGGPPPPPGASFGAPPPPPPPPGGGRLIDAATSAFGGAPPPDTSHSIGLGSAPPPPPPPVGGGGGAAPAFGASFSAGFGDAAPPAPPISMSGKFGAAPPRPRGFSIPSHSRTPMPRPSAPRTAFGFRGARGAAPPMGQSSPGSRGGLRPMSPSLPRPPPPAMSPSLPRPPPPPMTPSFKSVDGGPPPQQQGPPPNSLPAESFDMFAAAQLSPTSKSHIPAFDEREIPSFSRPVTRQQCDEGEYAIVKDDASKSIKYKSQSISVQQKPVEKSVKSLQAEEMEVTSSAPVIQRKGIPCSARFPPDKKVPKALFKAAEKKKVSLCLVMKPNGIY